MKKPKKIVRGQLDEISPYDFVGTLTDLKARVEGWITEYGNDARVDWDPDRRYPYDSSPSPCFVLEKDREETDEEYEKRMKDESVREARQKERELQELQRLQAKYGKAK